ncbi:MAG: 50S ribosomal protein L29 [Candidatus Verstraetearchaeota archaeon]|nr:50S ribosomal protein L29 [Candidatus Verstraetearchaeota archaeon]
MAIIRIDEIRKMGMDERSKKLSELKTELSKMMAMKAMGGSLENPARIRLLRKTIARFHTVSREEELGIRRAEKAEGEKKAKTKAKAKREKAEKEEGDEE